MRKLNKKILTLTISIFLILNIICSYSILAATTTKEDKEKKTMTTTTTNENGENKSTVVSTNGALVGADDVDVPWIEPSDYAIINNGCIFGGGAMTYDDLSSHGDLLCSQRGTLLTGSNSPSYDSLGESSSGSTHNKSEIPDLTPVRTQPNYTMSERKYASPEEAFILAFAQHSDGAAYGEYTPSQIAWWNTPAGQGMASSSGNFAAVSGVSTRTVGNAHSNDLEQISNDYATAINGEITTLSQTVGKAFDPNKNYNNLNDSAKDFQKYIIAAAGVNSVDQVERGEDGFFKLNYNPKWVEGKLNFEGKEYDCSKTTVTFDEATVDGSNVIVGPFAIDYVYSKNFAYITDMTLETDDSNHKMLEYGKDWKISNVRKSNEGYPGPNAPFYIIIKNKYDATKIKNIHVDFEYTNARGAFNYFEGEIKESKTNLTTTSKEIEKKDANGDTYYETEYTYSWEIIIGPLPSQRLAGNIDAEIRTFKTSLDRRSPNKGQIEIQKVIVDENGNELKLDKEDFFEFKLTVDGHEPERIRVKSNASATSEPYYWDGDKAPSFTVQEVNLPNGYEFVSIEPQRGTFEDGKTIKIVAKNTLAPKTGSIDLIKKAEESALGESNLIDADDTFEFEIVVSGKFRYNNGEYIEQSVPINVKVNADGNAHTVIPDGVIKWYDEAPKYDVKEINLPEGVEEVSIVPSSGSFVEGKTTITAVNKQKIERGTLQIIKTLENSNLFTEEDLKELEFNFKVKVDGHEEENVVATFFEKIQNADGTYTYTWKYESNQTYEWLAGHNPKYTIVEYNNPTGTAFDKQKTIAANSNNNLITVTDNGMTGTLVGNSDAVGVITNYVVNTVTPKKGKINLIKKVDEENLADKDYNFVVTVTGTFDYKGMHFENQTIQLTTENTNGYNVLENEDKYNDKEFVVINASKSNADEANGVFGRGDWTSDEFTWYGEAPKYKVQENLNGEDINYSIVPSSGTLEDNEIADREYLIVVTAWNGHDRVGYLHIIKELENSDKCDIDYLKTLKFKFKIHVDGYEEHTITLEPELKDDKWVWETKKDELKYSWRFDEEAPKYSIEEVDIPDGIVFVSANGQTTNKVEGTLVENKTTDVSIVATEVSVINRAEERVGQLIIDKKVTDASLNGKEFKMDVTLKGTFIYDGTLYKGEYKIPDVTVLGGSSWTSADIKWYGNGAPTYVVTEQESDIAEVVSIDNGTGTIRANAPGERVNIVTVTNKPKKIGGYLEITKQIQNGESGDTEFYFEVTIGNNAPYVISIKANETYKSDYIEWNASEEGPKYVVKEINIPEGYELVEIKNAEGNLKANETVTVVAINKVAEKHGKFKVTKSVVPNKYIDAAVKQEFEVRISILGTFIMNGETHYKADGPYVYTEKISVDVSKSHSSTYTSPEITWWGDEAPTVTVEEISMPQGWQQVGSPSNNGAGLIENGEIEIVVTNELPVYVEIYLTIDLAGKVWEDVRQDPGKNMLDSVPNGKIDSSEAGIKGVQVYVYRVAMNGDREVSRTLAKGYNDSLNSEITFPILTTPEGKWEAPRLHILSLTDEEKSKGAKTVKYDVEFVYDGQTYEPTLFLSKVNKEENKYIEGDAQDYLEASTSERDNFANRSMAKDYDRDDVNNRVQSIYGKTPLDGNGNTVGEVSGANNRNNVYYEANISGNDATRVESKLKTTDSQGVALDIFKTKARTSVGGLQYPFDSRSHLEHYDVAITGSGLAQIYKYSATYNYCLNINLGLVRREKVDVEATKDLYSAKVVVDGKELDYRFNKLEDLGKGILNRQAIDSAHVEYALGLYSTDYYYRAEIYRTNSEVYNAVNSFYKNVGRSMEDSEMEVYLTYKIGLHNSSSQKYVVGINSVDDYFDSSFGAPVKTSITKIVDGKEKEVANASYMKIGGSRTNVDWNVVEQNIKASDGKTYNKMVTNLNGVKLVSGDRAEIFVTFAMKKDNIDGVKNAIELGAKSNIVEIANYSTYYADGSVAGKIDLDSAPANVNIKEYNEKPWFEDDTDASPVLKLDLSNENRKVKGIAWEDKAEGASAIGNGIKDNNEALIGGLTTELVEKVNVDGKEYDFLWPTSDKLDCLGGKSLEDVTGGFSSTIETSREKTDVLNVGEYMFTNVPTGNHVVRFVYGNNITDLEDTSKASLKPAQALNGEGKPYYDSDLIYTSNYDEDIVDSSNGQNIVSTPAVYNGQDYKSTTYQKGFTSTTPDGYVNNEWHDLANGQLAAARVSDARDSESRRLEVIANSQTITNVNGIVLEEANEKDVTHTELYDDYYMYADTAKLDLDIEARDEAGLNGVNSETVNGTVFTNGSVAVEKEAKSYTIDNMDCGLIERPETAVILDKEINEIKLTTNDEKVIFDAKYDINYVTVGRRDIKDRVVITKLEDNKYLVAEVKLNESSIGIDQLQALDKNELKLTDGFNEGTQNFRFINIDDEILQGATIEIGYLITALNVGEVDYVSETLAKVSTVDNSNQMAVKQDILKLAEEARASTAVEFGKYLGTSYYTGNVNPDKDVVVKSKVRQVMEYIDNDAVFSENYNTESDHMWRNTTITELSGSGYDINRMVDSRVIPSYELIDPKGITYKTEQRNNLAISIDSEESGINSNANFEVYLTPYSVDNDNYKSQIALTITKVVSAQDDADNLTFDNIAEIVKFENSVGRRDVTVTAGNANPKLGEFSGALVERDSSATELVTFTPPTGNEKEHLLMIQILVVTIIALSIVVVGIVVIKKKVTI